LKLGRAEEEATNLQAKASIDDGRSANRRPWKRGVPGDEACKRERLDGGGALPDSMSHRRPLLFPLSSFPLSQLALQLGGVLVREYTHAISCARRSLSLPAHAQLTFPLRAQGTGGFFFSRVHPPPALAASVRRLGDDLLREATP